MPFDLRGSITSWESLNICWLGWHFLCIRRQEYRVSCSLTSGTFFLITVLAEGRQIWGRDQGPFWQAEGGNMGVGWSQLNSKWVCFCGAGQSFFILKLLLEYMCCGSCQLSLYWPTSSFWPILWMLCLISILYIRSYYWKFKTSLFWLK